MSEASWTRQAPTQPGWYWYRSKNARRRVIEIIERDGHLEVFAKGGFPYGPDAEWSGPLEPPR